MKKNRKGPNNMNKNKNKKVLVAMSGGVDSSVAAQLLKNQGFQVTGVFLHFWHDPQDKVLEENTSSSSSSLSDSRQVAQKIGIPFTSLNFSNIFKSQVVANFLAEYKIGRTPNPCVVCNQKVKIGRLLKIAKKMGFDYLATGHYLKLKKIGSEIQAFRARDRKKDQSYFLYTLHSQDLKSLLFPLGTYTKVQVRKLAEKFGLAIAHKPESQDLCFVSGSHNDFLKRHLKLHPGEIRSLVSKEKIGEHQGLPLYTIGQRRGLVNGRGPYYVARLDYKNNILYVVEKKEIEGLYQDTLIAKNLNWLNDHLPKKSLHCQALIRYGQNLATCLLIPNSKNTYLVKFSKKQRAISPGQSIVFYQKDRILGGGLIR